MSALSLAIDPVPTGGRYGYLGWTGHANLGDDAIAEVLGVALGPDHLDPVPMSAAALARALVTGGVRSLGSSRLLLGGGTVIGRANWRLHVAVGQRLCRGGPSVMIGAGVEDPSFRGRRSFSSFGELARWPQLLRRFERVTVRGPRSAALLADVGVDATVVGDPALLASAPSGVARLGAHLGVALGYGDDLRGGDHDRVVEEVGRAVRLVRRRGWRVTFLVVNPLDAAHVSACIDRAGVAPAPGEVEVLAVEAPASFCAAVATCEVVLAERLHAGVLAAACGAVPVMLAYQPKVDDFMASIGALDRCVATDAVRAERLVELLDDVHGDVVARRGELARAVAELRNALRGELAFIGGLGVPSGRRR